MTTSNDELRSLNDYESMLAMQTCNVGLALTLPRSEMTVQASNNLREAWSRCVAERRLLQVRLVAKEGDFGPLGQRYKVAAIKDEDKDALFVICESSKNELPDLVHYVQEIGTTALDIAKGSYHVACALQNEDEASHIAPKNKVQIVFSLSHALSDGPGALRVARSFLQHLNNVLDGSSGKIKPPQPLTDLQALILGGDYAAGQESKPVFVAQDEVTRALGTAEQPTKLPDGSTLLPPEAMQNIPHDEGFGGPSLIDCVHFSLTSQQTDSLRIKCREQGTTIQGALVAAALKARLNQLDQLSLLPITATVQIPVNTRSLAADEVEEDQCLCGSGGVWHTVKIESDNPNSWMEISKQSTQLVRSALQDDNASHVREWLRRLFHDPATLPPFSIMVSSIGVAPIDPNYGPNVQVDDVRFFGGSLRTDSPSQAVATMVHAVTFRGEFHCFLNFVSPGVAKAFAVSSAQHMKDYLVSVATN
jgi:hypothetical protein